MPLTTNQQMIVNTAMRLVSYFQDVSDAEKAQQPPPSPAPAMLENLVRVGANVLIDVNRIADALEERNRLDMLQGAVEALKDRATNLETKQAFTADDFAMWLTTQPTRKIGADQPVPDMIALLDEYKKRKIGN